MLCGLMLRTIVRRGLLLGALLLSLSPLLRAVPSTPGLYAVFDVAWGNPVQTGSFTAKLDYEGAPVTVANFVTLAEGTRPWLKLPTGELSMAPYYDGLTFHRVVANFVIQAGSPNGQGTDGPGYAFKDEFTSALTHSKAGILSMANSGIQSNGSQFFITLAATTGLNGLHSVFGEIVENLTVVQSIGVTPTNANTGAPLATARLVKVTIVRQGAAAEAWDALAQPLPLLTDGAAIATPAADKVNLNWPRPGGAQVFLYRSPDLKAWTFSGAPFDHDPAIGNGLDLTEGVVGAPQYFFRATRVQYPGGGILTPVSVRGRRLVITYPNNGGVVTVNFTGDQTGTYTWVSGTGGGFSDTLSFYYADPEPLRLRTGLILDGFGEFYTNAYYTDLAFTSANAGYGNMIEAAPAGVPPPPKYNFTFTWSAIP